MDYFICQNCKKKSKEDDLIEDGLGCPNCGGGHLKKVN